MSRDYKAKPLKRTGAWLNASVETPNKQDIEYLYYTLNCNRKYLEEYFKVSIAKIKQWFKIFGIKKDWNKVCECRNKTNLIKYGNSNPFGNKYIQNKIRQTNLKKYGVENPNRLKQIRDKIETTCLKKYGYKTALMNKKIRAQIETTNFKKYGCKAPAQNTDVIIKTKKTNHQKYGMDWHTQTQKSIIKIYKSKKLHNTFNTSKLEEQVYKLLIEKFKEVKRQYRSEKYPFNCDFYIPSKDLYIECNFHWAHGLKAYEGTKEDLQKIEKWEDKNTKYYNKAIEVWTERDVRKRQTAKKNKLSWIEFFDMKQFNDYIVFKDM